METDDHNLPQFFKVYLRQHSSNQLLIPREFVEYMGGRRSGSAELVVGSSCWSWVVELVEVGKDLYFADGWESFVKDNFVRDGQFLFFTLHGDLRFSVVIYDESMCEVEGDETVMDRSSPSSRPEFDKTTDSVNPSFEKSVRPSGFCIPKGFVRKHALRYETSETMILRTGRNLSWEVKINNHQDTIYLSGGWRSFLNENYFKPGDVFRFELLDRLEMMVHSVTRDECNLEKKVDVAVANVIPSKRAADGGETETVITPSLRFSHPKVETTDSIKPSFEKGVTQYGINIPKAFVREHSLSYKNSEMIVLRTGLNSYWEVKIITKNDKIRLSGGWRAFFNQNHFKAGDICKFELLNRLELMVHRVTGEEGNIENKVDVPATKIVPLKRSAEVSEPGFKRVKVSCETDCMSAACVQTRVTDCLKAEFEHLYSAIRQTEERLKNVKGILHDLRNQLMKTIDMDDEGAHYK